LYYGSEEEKRKIKAKGKHASTECRYVRVFKSLKTIFYNWAKRKRGKPQGQKRRRWHFFNKGSKKRKPTRGGEISFFLKMPAGGAREEKFPCLRYERAMKDEHPYWSKKKELLALGRGAVDLVQRSIGKEAL